MIAVQIPRQIQERPVGRNKPLQRRAAPANKAAPEPPALPQPASSRQARQRLDRLQQGRHTLRTGPLGNDAPTRVVVDMARQTHQLLLSHAQRSGAYALWALGSGAESGGPAAGGAVSGPLLILTALLGLYEAYLTQRDQLDAESSHQAFSSLLLQARVHEHRLRRQAGPQPSPREAVALASLAHTRDMLEQLVRAHERRTRTPAEQECLQERRETEATLQATLSDIARLEDQWVRAWRKDPQGEGAGLRRLRFRLERLNTRQAALQARLEELAKATPEAKRPGCERLWHPFDDLPHWRIKLLRDARLQVARSLLELIGGSLSLANALREAVELLFTGLGLTLPTACLSFAMSLLDIRDARIERRNASASKQQALDQVWCAMRAWQAAEAAPHGTHQALVCHVLHCRVMVLSRQYAQGRRATTQWQIRDGKGHANLVVSGATIGASAAALAGVTALTKGGGLLAIAVAGAAVGATYYGSVAELWLERKAAKWAREQRERVGRAIVGALDHARLTELLLKPEQFTRGCGVWHLLRRDTLAQDASLDPLFDLEEVVVNEWVLSEWLAVELHRIAMGQEAVRMGAGWLAVELLVMLQSTDAEQAQGAREHADHLIASLVLMDTPAEHLRRLRQEIAPLLGADGQPPADAQLPIEALLRRFARALAGLDTRDARTLRTLTDASSPVLDVPALLQALERLRLHLTLLGLDNAALERVQQALLGREARGRYRGLMEPLLIECLLDSSLLRQAAPAPEGPAFCAPTPGRWLNLLLNAMKDAGRLIGPELVHSPLGRELGRAMADSALSLPQYLHSKRRNPLATPERTLEQLQTGGPHRATLICTTVLRGMLDAWPLDEQTGQPFVPDGQQPVDSAALLRQALQALRSHCRGLIGSCEDTRERHGSLDRLLDRLDSSAQLAEALIGFIDASRRPEQRRAPWWRTAPGLEKGRPAPWWTVFPQAPTGESSSEQVSDGLSNSADPDASAEALVYA